MGNKISCHLPWRKDHDDGPVEAAPPQSIIMDTSTNIFVRQLINSMAQDNPSAENKMLSIGRSSLSGVRPMGAAVAVPKSGISLELMGNEKFMLCFQYTSRAPATVTFSFRQKHMGLTNGIPSFSDPDLQMGPYTLPVGSNQSFSQPTDEIMRTKVLTLEFCSFQREKAFVPILLTFDAPTMDYVLFIMGGLAHNEMNGSWDFVVTKQRVRQGTSGYELQEVYGLNTSALNSSAPGDSDEDIGRQRRCVVCLTNMKDTVVMPCRHMCLCHECASYMVSEHQFCPMCRSAISHICHMSQVSGS
ncbi:Zinc finger C3HC4 type (RING finger) family protein [Babesia bovis T2Bo]|uniref:RING-type domain-containing protein n=1 Tax=Babesia bovis TaxID=5865 RepID=A7ASN3_BABBO|nr:Zinc finger C3HC4 type (RING finger) family protein [Babesia bovis T2Bo]EDO07552.1 Zinc finger C3HC4 type (RING finger) family protein [Babesia bovis T2Bo]|eukprot:XP_001611120.1 hypothetical protein [Babesia bovis T2Bo]